MFLTLFLLFGFYRMEFELECTETYINFDFHYLCKITRLRYYIIIWSYSLRMSLTRIIRWNDCSTLIPYDLKIFPCPFKIAPSITFDRHLDSSGILPNSSYVDGSLLSTEDCSWGYSYSLSARWTMVAVCSIFNSYTAVLDLLHRAVSIRHRSVLFSWKLASDPLWELWEAIW